MIIQTIAEVELHRVFAANGACDQRSLARYRIWRFAGSPNRDVLVALLEHGLEPVCRTVSVAAAIRATVRYVEFSTIGRRDNARGMAM